MKLYLECYEEIICINKCTLDLNKTELHNMYNQ